MTIDYKRKYLKYKEKYLNFGNKMYGANVEPPDTNIQLLKDLKNIEEPTKNTLDYKYY